MKIDYIYNICYGDMGEFHLESSFIDLEKAVDRLSGLNSSFDMSVFNVSDGKFNFSIDYVKNKDKQYYLDEFNRKVKQ